VVVGEREVPHGGSGLALLCDWLVALAGDASAVAVACSRKVKMLVVSYVQEHSSSKAWCLDEL
jgi:hypothetical protein